jgi:hypothetical protein
LGEVGGLALFVWVDGVEGVRRLDRLAG